MKIYLAGPILHATSREMSEWREYAKGVLEEHGHEAWLPLEMISFCEEMGLPATERTFEQIITVRDKYFSTQCDVLLANFGPGGVDKVSAGTCIELGWASAAGVTIVGVLPPGNVHNHPIIDALLTFRVTELEHAIDIILALGEGWGGHGLKTSYESKGCGKPICSCTNDCNRV